MSWLKIKKASQYAGVSPRTFRKWLKSGLCHAKLPSGLILIRADQIDEWMKRYETSSNQIDKVVDFLMEDLKTKRSEA